MFIHNFKYSLKTLFRDRMLIFWTFAFPIILGTFFNMAFSNIESSEKLEIINIAIVNNEDFQNQEIFKKTFEKLSDEENDDRLFDTKYVTEGEAKKLLEDNEISGFLILDGESPKIVVAKSGINETIFKQVIEQITQTSQMIGDLSKNEIQKEIIDGNYNINYEKIYENILGMIENEKAEIQDISSSKLSYTMIEFYTLIAMSCLYGGILGMVAINRNLANMSSKGKRVSVSPTSKVKVVLSSLIASYITQLIGLTLLFMYTIFVLKIDYGTNLPLIILLGVVGSFAGLSMGLTVATIFKTNENLKTGIIIAFTMFRLFFIWNDGNYNEVYY